MTCTRCLSPLTQTGPARYEDEYGFQSCGISSVAGAHVPSSR